MPNILQVATGISILFLTFNTMGPLPSRSPYESLRTSKPTTAATSENLTNKIPDDVKKKLPKDTIIEKPIKFNDLIAMYNKSLVENSNLKAENKKLRTYNTILELERTNTKFNTWHVGGTVVLGLTLLLIAYLIG